jgi:hypothetical protein
MTKPTYDQIATVPTVDEMHEEIVKGNVFYGVQNEVEVMLIND